MIAKLERTHVHDLKQSLYICKLIIAVSGCETCKHYFCDALDLFDVLHTFKEPFLNGLVSFSTRTGSLCGLRSTHSWSIGAP